MYYPKVKEEALRLRRNGASLGDISKKLNVTKSTLSYWCKDIVLTESKINKIQTQGKEKSVRALLRYAESKRLERLQREMLQRREGAERLRHLSSQDIFMIGLGLYWGEGYKYAHSELGFTNSNPDIIRFYILWLRSWEIKKENLVFRLTINDIFRKEEKAIKTFWIKLLSVKEEQFSKTTFIKTVLKKASFKNKEKYKGVLRVKVRKGRATWNRILGALDHISDLKKD